MWVLIGIKSLQIEVDLSIYHKCSGNCLQPSRVSELISAQRCSSSGSHKSLYSQQNKEITLAFQDSYQAGCFNPYGGINNVEHYLYFCYRMLLLYAHWGLAQHLGSRSWITPPGMLPLSRGNLLSSYAFNRGSLGLCGRWVSLSTPSVLESAHRNSQARLQFVTRLTFSSLTLFSFLLED